MSRAITVLVGTDHHPFTRLVAWADAWQRGHPEDRVTVQYGFSRAPEVAAGIDLMTPDELRSLVAGSDVVVTHGGPGTIMDTRGAGHRPVVVARNPALGEHVDNHQMLFAAWAAGKGLVRLIDGPQELESLIDELGEAGTRDDSPTGHSTEATAERLERLLAALDERRAPTAVDATTVLHLSGSVPLDAAPLLAPLLPRPDVVVLGDVRRVWEEGVLGDEPCACGELFSACPFWSAVGAHAFGGWADADVERVLGLEQALHRRGGAALPRLGRRRAELRVALVELSTYFRKVYDAARQVSGATVVVDAGGPPPLALALSHNRHIDLRVLHVQGGGPAVTGTAEGRAGRSGRRVLKALGARCVPVAAVEDTELRRDPDASLGRAWAALGLPLPAPETSPAGSEPSPWNAHAYLRKDA